MTGANIMILNDTEITITKHIYVCISIAIASVTF